MPVLVRENYWVLETDHSAYAFGVTPRGVLVHTYWGARLGGVEDYPAAVDGEIWASWSAAAHSMQEEYPAYAGTKYTEPCLKTTFADGVRDTVLCFIGAEVIPGEQPRVRVRLRDECYPLQVVLCYRLHEQYDIVERLVEIENEGDTPINLERVFLRSGICHGDASTVSPPCTDVGLRSGNCTANCSKQASRRVRAAA